MNSNVQVFDVLGTPLLPGDRVVQYRGNSQKVRCGTITGLCTGRDGRSRIIADGDFSRAFLPKALLNLSALGVPLAPRERPVVYPDDCREYREYNRQHVRDMIGTEARAGDHVLFWMNSKTLASGDVHRFSGDSAVVTLTKDLDQKNHVRFSVRPTQFLIYEGKCPVPEGLLYQGKDARQKPAERPKQKTQQEKLKEAVTVIDIFWQLFAGWESGNVPDSEFRTSVDQLMNVYRENASANRRK